MSDPSRPVVTGYPAQPTYPYTTHPPPPPYSNYYFPQTQTQEPTSFFKKLFTILIATTILFITITLIAYLILKPQLPIFNLTSANISNFTISNTSLLSFTSQIHLSSRNPNNKLLLDFDHVEAGLFYDWYALSETNVVPFKVGKESESELVANFASSGGFVERGVVEGIDRERKGNVVEFGFRLICSVGFEAKAWRTRKFVRAFCPVVVEFLAGDGRLRGGTRPCKAFIV